MPATPAQLAELPDALRLHYQFNGDFCAVSGFECIAKLHGLLARDAFPLQGDPTNQYRGFEPDHYAYLTARGFNCTDLHHPTGAAAGAVIQTETEAGRFPLAALPWRGANGNWGYHIFLFARHEGVTLWIDPAIPCVMLRGMDAVPQALENVRVNNPLGRRTIHLLTYARLAGGDAAIV